MAEYTVSVTYTVCDVDSPEEAAKEAFDAFFHPLNPFEGGNDDIALEVTNEDTGKDEGLIWAASFFEDED